MHFTHPEPKKGPMAPRSSKIESSNFRPWPAKADPTPGDGARAGLATSARPPPRAPTPSPPPNTLHTQYHTSLSSGRESTACVAVVSRLALVSPSRVLENKLSIPPTETHNLALHGAHRADALAAAITASRCSSPRLPVRSSQVWRWRRCLPAASIPERPR